MALQKMVTGNATCQCLTGAIVGLHTTSEQHITGHASIRGEQSLSGQYHGAYGNVPARGEARGFGYLIGESHMSTEYSYYTHFFVRDEKGVDHPVVIAGRIPLMNDHTVTLIYVKNIHRKVLLCSVVNHNSQRPYHTISKRDLIDHLDMPTRRRVRRELVSPADKRDEIKQLRNKWSAVMPWLYVALLIGLTVFFVGLIVSKKRDTAGFVIAFMGLLPALAALGSLSFRYLLEWRIRYQPTHELVVVRNQELDDELDAIGNYIDDVVESICH